MILVAGSTGLLGSEICRQLGENGRSFRALVRETSEPAKVARLQGYGAEIIKGDLRDLSSLRAACKGADTVICTVSSIPFSYMPGVNDPQMTDMEGVTQLINAASAAGSRHMIYTSFTMDRAFPLRNAKRAVETNLKASGLDYTILRPSFFMEAWLSPVVGFDPANARATIYGSGDQPIGWISLRDVAKFAVASVDNTTARNCTLVLGGPENLSPHQVIQQYEQVTGKSFDISYVPGETLQAQFDGATDAMQKSFTGLILCYAGGDPVDMRENQRTFGIRLTTLKEFIGG